MDCYYLLIECCYLLMECCYLLMEFCYKLLECCYFFMGYCYLLMEYCYRGISIKGKEVIFGCVGFEVFVGYLNRDIKLLAGYLVSGGLLEYSRLLKIWL